MDRRRMAQAGLGEMGSLPFHTLDVFTAERFQGNPLAVVLEAGGLPATQMQAIAREFNLSETVFVTRLDAAAGRAAIRIFTPRTELPFAGHPTVGTALLLAGSGLGVETASGRHLVLEEAAGDVPVDIVLERGTPVSARFTAPGEATFGERLEPRLVAPAFGLDAGDLAGMAPRAVGFGAPFLLVELASLEALGRAAVATLPAVALEPVPGQGAYLFTRATGDRSIRARFFAPLLGIAEDPATGSAAAGLAALLARVETTRVEECRWQVVQGVEMGRRSVIEISAERRPVLPPLVKVAGGAVPVTEGRIRL